MFIKKYFLFIFVFVTGAAVMMLEMAAFRLLTPYFGASLFVWANIIGLVMIALSIGYYFGGKLADLHPQRKILMLIVLFSGVLTGFIPIISKLILPFFVGSSLKPLSALSESLLLSSFLFTTILFVAPLTLLGIVSPFVIRLQNKEVETVGCTSGSIYAFSTIGSIFGTFFAAFFTVPVLGIKETFFISAFCLILISLIGLGKELKKPLILILLLPIILNYIPFQKRANLVFEKESFYGLIEVIYDQNLGYVLDINRSGRWSVYHPEKILTGAMYFDYFVPLYFLLEKKENLDMLIIGHAGGVTSRQYSYFFKDKNLNIDGVELDPEVTKAAYKFFALSEQPNLNVVNLDARIYLKNTSKKYDLIFMDAYISDLYLPFQLSTTEFFNLISSHLKDEGIFAAMIISQNPEKEKVFQSISQTIRAGFPYGYFFPAKSRREYLILASKLSLAERLSILKEITEIEDLKAISLDISQNFQEIGRFEENHILTDNRAPVELLREFDKINLYFASFKEKLLRN